MYNYYLFIKFIKLYILLYYILYMIVQQADIYKYIINITQ